MPKPLPVLPSFRLPVQPLVGLPTVADTTPVASADTTPKGPADTLVTTTPPTAPRPTPREQVAMAEKLMGRKVRFKTDAELDAYLRSVELAKPQESYDREGFLAKLGLTGLRASGRTDRPTLDAVRAVKSYRPETTFHDKPIWVQQRAFDLAIHHPKLFMTLTKGTNPIIEAKGKLEHDWTKPFVSKQTPVPTGVSAADRYKDALAKLPELDTRFDKDFHGGLPEMVGADHPTYGTYAIALSLGFSDAAARRFGSADVGIDDNTTPYGKTSPSPLDKIDRHFNLDRDAQDTRLVYAANHLQAAVALAKQTSYDQAEIELGAGLHSLQDLFAHGQLSPSMHAVLGQFPDEVDWNPVAFYEATGATAAYLAAYLNAIKPAAEQPAAPVAPVAQPAAAQTPRERGPQP